MAGTGDGWKVRPRALTLTLFTPIGFADGFIHGIGGGKYDEVTDDIMRRFFQIEPPGYAVVSAMIRLPIAKSRGRKKLHAAERAIRDLDWNPQTSARRFAGKSGIGLREGPPDRGRADGQGRPPRLVPPVTTGHTVQCARQLPANTTPCNAT